MRRVFIISTLLGVMLLFIAAISSAPKKISLWMAGDSTMCMYEDSRAPLAGWGMTFAGFFDSSISMHNHARGGRSTRTFINEKRWQSILDSIGENDYVFIQFGHNDEAKEEKYKDRYTPLPDYKANLRMFIQTSKLKKANPVLITPVSRMRFDKEGIAAETHREYSAAVWEVGKEQQVPVIDLDKNSLALIQKMGPQDAKLLFMQLDSLQHPNYPAGLKDNTHFNSYGARRMAELVLADVRSLLPDLATRIVNSPVKK